MSGARDDDFGPGVYFEGADGARKLVFAYQDGSYRLTDINGLWQFGRIEGGARDGESVLVFGRGEMGKLKTMSDAFSFDYDEEFIEMCHELYRFTVARPDEVFRFVATF